MKSTFARPDHLSRSAYPLPHSLLDQGRGVLPIVTLFPYWSKACLVMIWFPPAIENKRARQDFTTGHRE